MSSETVEHTYYTCDGCGLRVESVDDLRDAGWCEINVNVKNPIRPVGPPPDWRGDICPDCLGKLKGIIPQLWPEPEDAHDGWEGDCGDPNCAGGSGCSGGRGDCEQHPKRSFKCLESMCDNMLVITGSEGEQRVMARECGWSVASDDFGDESICPIHRNQWGR